MDAYCDLKDSTFCVSANEITEMSKESEYWIKGFLIGNEPEPPEENEKERPEDYFSSGRYKIWVAKIKEFRKSGQWEYENE
jgi:hypothetical protein